MCISIVGCNIRASFCTLWVNKHQFLCASCCNLFVFLLNRFVKIQRNSNLMSCTCLARPCLSRHGKVTLLAGRVGLPTILFPRLSPHLHTFDIRGKPCLSTPDCHWTNMMRGLMVIMFISVLLYFAVWPVSCRSGWMWVLVRFQLWGFVIGGIGHFVQQRPCSPDCSWVCWHRTVWGLLFPGVVEANLLLTFSS